MEQLIQDQKQVNEDQKQVIESLKSGKYSDERDKESKKYYTTYFIKFISSYPCTFSIKYNKLFFRLERNTKQQHEDHHRTKTDDTRSETSD